MKVADMEKVSAFQGLVASHYRDYYATLNIGYIYMFMLVFICHAGSWQRPFEQRDPAAKEIQFHTATADTDITGYMPVKIHRVL
jgi:hypothetical protein